MPTEKSAYEGKSNEPCFSGDNVDTVIHQIKQVLFDEHSFD